MFKKYFIWWWKFLIVAAKNNENSDKQKLFIGKAQFDGTPGVCVCNGKVFFFWGTLFLRKLYLKNFNIKKQEQWGSVKCVWKIFHMMVETFNCCGKKPMKIRINKSCLLAKHSSQLSFIPIIPICSLFLSSISTLFGMWIYIIPVTINSCLFYIWNNNLMYILMVLHNILRC